MSEEIAKKVGSVSAQLEAIHFEIQSIKKMLGILNKNIERIADALEKK